MDGYKKIIKNKNARFVILNLLKWIPDKIMLDLQYFIKFKRRIDWENPRRFTEKIQLYKLNHKYEDMIVCSDKYKVREYISKKGLDYILIDLYFAVENINDIDFSKLPDKFIIKLSNGSGTNYICRDKSKIDLNELSSDFKNFKLRVKSNSGREWPYMKSKSTIVVEKLLEDFSHINNAVNDYKIFCYDGKPEYVICVSDRYSDKVNHLVYNVNWEKINVISEGARLNENVPKPNNLSEMLQIASRLSEGFPFVRVDLYSVYDKVFFGEMTFFPWSGYMEFNPDEFDFELGSKFLNYR